MYSAYAPCGKQTHHTRDVSFNVKSNLDLEDLNQKIRNVDSEMSNCQYKLDRIKKRIPFGILIGVVFAFLFPYLPGRRGRRPMIETWEYSNAVIFSAVIFAIIYPIGYVIGKNKLEKKLRELKLKKHLIEKELQK